MSGPGDVGVLLVDDQPLARAGLRRILEPQDGITVIGECEDGDQVVAAVARRRPDVVVMDVRMRRVDGAEATRRLMASPAAPPVLVLTTFDDDETVAAALGAGAAGFVLKDAPGEEIVRAVTTVAQGGSWLDPQVVGRVLATYRRVAGARPPGPDGTEQLTSRELDVLRQVGRRRDERRGGRGAARERGDGQEPPRPGADEARAARPCGGNRVRAPARGGVSGPDGTVRIGGPSTRGGPPFARGTR